MRVKLNRAANQIIKRKIWRDKQIKAIEADLNRLEDTIRDNWDTIGYVGREVLYSAHDYIEKYRFNPYSNGSSFFMILLDTRYNKKI